MGNKAAFGFACTSESMLAGGSTEKTRIEMLPKIAKYFAVVALLPLIVLWRSSDNRTLIAACVVCAAAALASVHAFRTRKLQWIVAFLGIIALFHPLVPPSLTQSALVSLYLGSVGIFLLSLRQAAPPPPLAIASICERAPGSESL